MRCWFPGGPVQAATRFNRHRTLERGGLLSRDWAGAAGHNMFCGQSHVLKEPENENRVFVINPEIAFLELILSTTKVPIPSPVAFLSLKIKQTPLCSSEGAVLRWGCLGLHVLPAQAWRTPAPQYLSGRWRPAKMASPKDRLSGQTWPRKCGVLLDDCSGGAAATKSFPPPRPKATLHDRTCHPHVLLLFAKGI